MESRSTWTDERLDDRFDHIDSELTHLRIETRQGFVEGNRRTDNLGAELRGEINGLRAEIGDLRLLMIRLNIGLLVAMAGAFATVIARGA